MLGVATAETFGSAAREADRFTRECAEADEVERARREGGDPQPIPPDFWQHVWYEDRAYRLIAPIYIGNAVCVEGLDLVLWEGLPRYRWLPLDVLLAPADALRWGDYRMGRDQHGEIVRTSRRLWRAAEWRTHLCENAVHYVQRTRKLNELYAFDFDENPGALSPCEHIALVAARYALEQTGVPNAFQGAPCDCGAC